MASSSAVLVGGLYTIDFTRQLEGAAPPATVFAAQGGGQAGCMAVLVARGSPARPRPLAALAGLQQANLLAPLAHGSAPMPSGDTGYFVICPAPPGPSLEATLRPWPETELIDHLVKPVALVLAELQARGVSHRAIRPANLFQAARGTAVSLGCAWAAPPAMHQPAWIEPPYSATCLPSGRGDGTIADDVYALGSVMVMLALGRNPVEGVPDSAVLAHKLENGSYAALVGGHRLPPAIAELARGMLADDPEHRPSPALLATPNAARARRIAARPIRRSQRPIEVGGRPATTARSLASLLQQDPKTGIAMLRNGSIDGWLRRGLGDALAAAQVNDAVGHRDTQAASGDALADPMLIASAVAILDPFAPLAWRSAALWPDGLGPALDHALQHTPELSGHLAEIATANVVEPWASKRDGARDGAGSRPGFQHAHAMRKERRTGVAIWRLCYSLNPLAPCASPTIGNSWVTRLADLLPAMEQAAAGRPAGGPALVDIHIAAFIAARRDERLHGDLGQLAADLPADDPLAHLHMVARAQAKLHPAALPNLCAWAVEAIQPHLQQFSSRSRRTRMAAELAALAIAGHLPPIAKLLDARGELDADTKGSAAAQARLAEIQQTLAALTGQEEALAGKARRIGNDMASGLGAIACLTALAWALFA